MRKTGKKGEGGGARRMKRPPKRPVLRLKSVAKATRTRTTRPVQPKPYRHNAEVQKISLVPSHAATPKPAKTRSVPNPPPFKPKPLRVTTTAKMKPRAMASRPLPRLTVPPLRRPAALRLPILRLSEPLPETAYKEAKAQLRVMRRAARILRKADRAQERTVKELVRHAAHDLFERQRQAGEANREFQRQQREQDRADALRPAQPTRTTGQPPQL